MSCGRKTKRAFAKADIYYPWTKDYAGQLAGVDAQGNVYVRDAVPGAAWHKASPSEKQTCLGVIRQYGPDSRLRNPALCRLFHRAGSVAMDSKGNFYAVNLPLARWATVVHDFPYAIGDKKIRDVFERGGLWARRQSDFTHLVKFGPDGGKRNSETELRVHRGFSPSNGGGCFCDWPDKLVAVDDADRIYGADTDHPRRPGVARSESCAGTKGSGAISTGAGKEFAEHTGRQPGCPPDFP